ncbi:AsmA family protein [Luteimonas sp. e5]
MTNKARGERVLAWPRRHPLASVFALLALGLMVLILLWDWNWFKRPVERFVSASTGREFHIDGDLDVKLGRLTRIRVDGLRLGNAEWSKEALMASSERLEFTLPLLPAIFKHELRIPELRLTRPRLLLETGPEGEGNWVFKSRRKGGGNTPEFRQLWVEGGELRFVNAKGKTDIDIRVDSTAPGADDSGPPIEVKGKGHWKGNAFTLEGRGESPLALTDREAPYRIDVRAVAGATRAHVRGDLLDPLRLRDFDLQLELAGSSMEALYPLLGIAAPPTPPYVLDGRLTRVVHSASSSTWKYDDFSGKVGDSDLGGFAHFTTGEPRPRLDADLRSTRLDLDDLAGFIGGAPQSGGGETSSAQQKTQAARQAARGKLFPSEEYRLDKLRAMDAQVRLRATRILTRVLPVDNMDARLELEAGVMTLAPLDFGVADGRIRSQIRMDAREDTIRTTADIDASGLTLGKLMPKVELGENAIGKVAGNVRARTHGNSIAAMLGHADGEADVGMGRGHISKLLMEMAAIDLAGILKIKLTQDEQIPIRCAYGDFNIKDGVMTPNELVFDTSETVIVGVGTIDLGKEQLDLVLRPKTRKFSPLSLRSPLHVEGSFTQPRIRPDYARMGLRAAAAVALGSAAAPAAALAATSDLGSAKGKRYCGEG